MLACDNSCSYQTARRDLQPLVAEPHGCLRRDAGCRSRVGGPPAPYSSAAPAIHTTCTNESKTEIVGWTNLNKHIDGRATDLTLLQRIQQVRLADDPSSSHIDHLDTSLALSQSLAREEILRLRNERDMHRDVVSSWPYLRQLEPLDVRLRSSLQLSGQYCGFEAVCG
jgi:hypothetical protein